MKNETDILKLLNENKIFCLLHYTKEYPVYDDTDRFIEGYNTDKEENSLLSFDSCIEMSDFLGELSVSDGESENTEHHKVLFCNPKNYWEHAKAEQQRKDEEQAEDKARGQQATGHKCNACYCDVCECDNEIITEFDKRVMRLQDEQIGEKER